MWRVYHRCLLFLWTLFVQNNVIQTSYIRHLTLPSSINHLTYSSSFKWLYVASTDSLSVYDDNLTLVQNISLANSYSNDDELCQINSCQCLHNSLNNNNNNPDDIIADRSRRSKFSRSIDPLNSFNRNNYNLLLYLERENTIDNQPYLIDCWSLQSGSCVIRSAVNISNVYYQQTAIDAKNPRQKFLFNTDSTIPSHIFPFHFKLNKCNDTPIYLFLSSTLRKNLVGMNTREKTDNVTELFYDKCLEQSQGRTIALRAFVFNNGIKRVVQNVNKPLIPRDVSSLENFTIVRDSITKRQVYNQTDSINGTRSTLIDDRTRVRSSRSSSQFSSTVSTISDGHITNSSSTLPRFDEPNPFININDYCPEQFSVVRTIYKDFFERESPDKFRLFQDVIYDKKDSAIYVFTNQQHVSKVVRLCEGQISFRHYVELQINCGNDYTLIQKVKLVQTKDNKQYLLTIASKPKALDSLEPSISSHSAICLYNFDQIRNAFIDNILDLAKGNVSLGMAWLHGESTIPQYPTPYGNLARCSTTRDASYLMIFEGSTNIISEPMITFLTDQLTALEAAVINNYIVALAGTADGKIKKISIELATKKTHQFEEVYVDFNHSILRDMTLNENNRFLYGATKSRLFQVDLHDCNRHKTCSACLSMQNPICGWTTTLNRCTTYSDQIGDARRFSWLQMDAHCPTIVNITPAVISNAKSSKLRLKVESMPDDTTSTYSCSFGLSSLITVDEHDYDRPIYISNAIKHENDIECYSPPAQTLSNINHDSLIIRLFYNDIVLTEKNLTFYDCSSYLTCTSCMNNSFDCSWNLLDAKCVDSDLILDKNETIISNSSIIQCPRYNVSKHEIFIADGEQLMLGNQEQVVIQTISLKTSIQNSFRCILILNNGSIISTIGKVQNDLLTCDPFRIFYDKDVGQQSSLFEIQWTECEGECTYKTLETSTNLTVNIYKCKHLADSCGSCILLHDDYRCLWCETDKSCRHEVNSSNCQPNHIISSSMGICPDPRLTEIHPKIGPEYGRTPIHIYGSSLGKKPHDIYVVLIHSNQTEYQCQVQNESYITAQSFVCQPPSLPVGKYTIKVTVHSVVSKDRPIFRIVKPNVDEVHPNIGPRSGGTVLSIKGKHLTIGSKINILVGHQQCFLIENKETLVTNIISEDENNQRFASSTFDSDVDDQNAEEIIKCRTSKLTDVDEENQSRQQRFVKRQALWIGSLTILIDNFTETYSNITYSYTEDPHVHNLSRYSGIQSGGLPFLVQGSNFDSIQTPQFFVESNQKHIFIESCTVKSSETMLCYSPSFAWMGNETSSTTPVALAESTTSTIASMLNPQSFSNNHCLEFKFGFFMDNVDLVRNISNYREVFLLCPDPIIHSFNNDGRRIQYRYDYLTIEGSNLLDVATINDYSITIGSFPCNITSISDKQIVCQPTNQTIEKLIRKKRLLLNINTKDSEQAIVRVTLGRRIYTLGTLTYISNMEKRSLVLYYIIASVCGFLLTIFIIVISIVFRRINTKRTRQLNRLQNQIDTLEMRVARECKEAFAELQTDIGEMTNDLSHSGVPYHDYRTYCMKILFPNATEEDKYMMLHNIEIPFETNRRNSVRQGLHLLAQSLYNRHFLLLIIRTLETDKVNFRLQDRMQFASLISILLQENIEYFTEILKIMLKDLIDKSLQQDRNNSKILLRSNASIAEKMLSNWFAFLLFGYVKERLGSPLYILFQSIKQQIQKGPIDCFTSESRYSLSEDKLLRQHIDYLSMIVYVVQVEDGKSHLISTPVPIKVLSCDSIIQ
ncbi:unnamed protein product, partial [Adineta ricciae]